MGLYSQHSLVFVDFVQTHSTCKRKTAKLNQFILVCFFSKYADSSLHCKKVLYIAFIRRVKCAENKKDKFQSSFIRIDELH